MEPWKEYVCEAGKGGSKQPNHEAIAAPVFQKLGIVSVDDSSVPSSQGIYCVAILLPNPHLSISS